MKKYVFTLIATLCAVPSAMAMDSSDDIGRTSSVQYKDVEFEYRVALRLMRNYEVGTKFKFDGQNGEDFQKYLGSFPDYLIDPNQEFTISSKFGKFDSEKVKQAINGEMFPSGKKIAAEWNDVMKSWRIAFPSSSVFDFETNVGFYLGIPNE